MHRHVLVLCCLCAPLASCRKPPDSTRVDDLRHDLVRQTQALWRDVADERWVASARDEHEGLAELGLLRAYQSLGDRLDLRGVGYNELPAELGSVWAWARAEAELKGVEALYNTFRRFQRQQLRRDVQPAPPRAWADLAETILYDPTASVPNAFDRLDEITANKMEGEGTLYQQLLLESGGNLCSLQQSPQQILYNVYNTAALTELKGYAMMQFSWMLLRLYNKGNFTVESRIMQERYKERTEQKIAAVKSAMASAKREIYRCDPKLHVEGETYVQLTRLLQGHIQNEVDMNRDSTCRENCGYYSYAQNHGCYQNMYCARQQKCSGKLIDCKYYDSDMWVCPADSSTSRRYDWIEYENGRVLGQKASCRTGSTKVDSWWRWLFWHCSYCFCLCDEQGPRSDRYFNLRPVEADVANNKVVTGLRLVKHNRLIHMQVQEAPLLPSGGVNASAARWRPVDDYEITDVDVQNGVDYHTLTWEQRAVDLDDLVAPPGHVLTGFRFRKVGTHLNPEIMSTPYNFSAGLLIQPLAKSVWLSNDNTAASLDAPRTQLPLPHADVPTRSQLPSLPDSRPEQFLLFTHSGVDADAAQTTVPFLDAQPLTPEPLTLLAGAGLHHKGRAGYGGFVAPKLITYDYSQHIQALYPPAKN